MITGFIHPVTGRKHSLQSVGAITPVIPEGVLLNLVYKEKMDDRHKGTAITVTSGLSCPRKTMIHRMLPVHVNPSKMWAALRGTWLHEHIGHAMSSTGLYYTEELDESKCVFEGILFGITMSCKVDAYTKDYSELLDFKFRGRMPRDLYPTDIAQMNMCRILMEQVTHMDLSGMRMHIWVEAGGWCRFEVPFMSMEEVGALHPGGSEMCVQDIFHTLARSMEKCTGGNEKEVIRALPLVGQKMYVNKNGNMCSHYCEVQEECMEMEGEL